MRFLIIFLLIAFCGCKKEAANPLSEHFEFGLEQEVDVSGYDDHIMEPFLSRDGKLLFFNNLNQPHVNTDLHYASMINDSVFQYMGTMKGANSVSLDAVPSMDDSGNLYFVSTRSYEQSLASVYCGSFFRDTVKDIHIVQGLSKNMAGWVNFDIEVSKNGNILFTVDGLFDENGGPYESDLVVAVKNDSGFIRTGDGILENINTGALEYGACISADMLELYFTRLEIPMSLSSVPQIFLATRKSIDEPFRNPYRIEEIAGFAEAPTISADGNILYYHKKVNEMHSLYMIRKK
ncbi:MAG: hypothetical protein R6V34_02535 [Bacteroidales bacterium]